ncbi:hypothetical protein BHE74_00040797 [Ensete ventricosum]|nr:hypothetical protein BHE74_00040797 [Ensete ventricosum]
MKKGPAPSPFFPTYLPPAKHSHRRYPLPRPPHLSAATLLSSPLTATSAEPIADAPTHNNFLADAHPCLNARCRRPSLPSPASPPPPLLHLCTFPLLPPLLLPPVDAASATALVLSSFPAAAAARPLGGLPLLPHLSPTPLVLPFLPCRRLLAAAAAATHCRNLLPTAATLVACSPRSLPPTAVISSPPPQTQPQPHLPPPCHCRHRSNPAALPLPQPSPDCCCPLPSSSASRNPRRTVAALFLPPLPAIAFTAPFALLTRPSCRSSTAVADPSSAAQPPLPSTTAALVGPSSPPFLPLPLLPSSPQPHHRRPFFLPIVRQPKAKAVAISPCCRSRLQPRPPHLLPSATTASIATTFILLLPLSHKKRKFEHH